MSELIAYWSAGRRLELPKGRGCKRKKSCYSAKAWASPHWRVVAAGFRTAVWKERYHALAYENKAYFDIQRTRKAYNVVNNRFVAASGGLR
jgi:hypothetical protein